MKAEALKESTDWDAAAGEMKRLQAEWKTIGPVKKSRSEAMWQRFRGAADHFFARHVQRHDIALGKRVAARVAICQELENLAAPPVISHQSSVSSESSVNPQSAVNPESAANPESSVNPESAVDNPQSGLRNPDSAKIGRASWRERV